MASALPKAVLIGVSQRGAPVDPEISATKASGFPRTENVRGPKVMSSAKPPLKTISPVGLDASARMYGAPWYVVASRRVVKIGCPVKESLVMNPPGRVASPFGFV